MNKRQKKKRKKKYLPVIADEFNLLSMSDEEREKAYRDYENFVRRYAYRMKYKNLKGKFLTYYFPVGQNSSKYLTEVSDRCRRERKKPLCTITQGISDFNILQDVPLGFKETEDYFIKSRSKPIKIGLSVQTLDDLLE